MKYCAHCGNELEDETMFCPKCGTPTEGATNPGPTVQPVSSTPAVQTAKKNSTSETLRLIAFILCLISTIACGWCIIPLAWMVPLTISVYKGYKGEKEMSMALRVCVLIFVNMIAGILLLVDNDQ